jgi:hypothetical protein
MTDVELARALERCEIPDAGFHHADHLRVALVYLSQTATVEEAIERMAATVRRFADSVGKADKYSQPITDFWMYQLAGARALLPGASADRLFTACPCLLDKNLVLAYYSSDAAPPGSAHSSRHAPDRAVSGGPAPASAVAGRGAHPGAAGHLRPGHPVRAARGSRAQAVDADEHS